VVYRENMGIEDMRIRCMSEVLANASSILII